MQDKPGMLMLGSYNNLMTMETHVDTPSGRPQRPNRVIDPAGPDRPRAKRTPAEVLAGNQASEDRKKRLQAIEQEKHRLLAEMELDAAQTEGLEDVNTIRTLADHERLQPAKPVATQRRGQPLPSREAELLASLAIRSTTMNRVWRVSDDRTVMRDISPVSL